VILVEAKDHDSGINNHTNDINNPNSGYNNHNSGYKLPIKWYYKWWFFLTITFIVGLTIGFIFPSIAFIYWQLAIAIIVAATWGIIWGIGRGRHIRHLEDERRLNEIYELSKKMEV
jgi:hypothetical protein